MIIGYRQIQKIENLKLLSESLGMRFESPRHGYRDSDAIALVPKDQDALPIYTRDTELFIGALDEIEIFLKGIVWATQYYQMLGLVDDKKIERKEQNERNRQLMSLIKNSESNKDKK